MARRNKKIVLCKATRLMKKAAFHVTQRKEREGEGEGEGSFWVYKISKFTRAEDGAHFARVQSIFRSNSCFVLLFNSTFRVLKSLHGL